MRLSRGSRGKFIGAALVGVAVLAIVGVALAQNFSLAPRYGTASLRPGFMPDPHSVTLTAGGTINTRTSGPAPACGYVANNPDFRLNWGGGSTLNIYAIASSDTTLLINMPNGSWRCNDDGGSGTNPLLTISNAPAGQYDIWVGTYTSGNAPAQLRISELAPRW
jgi:hypothetical protein